MLLKLLVAVFVSNLGVLYPLVQVLHSNLLGYDIRESHSTISPITQLFVFIINESRSLNPKISSL
jgi:hypothetical protein